MQQLSYQPALDPYHAVYRLLRLRESVLRTRDLFRDQIRILDYYLLFPFRIGGLRLQPSHRKFRRLTSKYAWTKPYGDLPDDRILFGRMESLQTSALDTLAARDLIDAPMYASGVVKATRSPVPDPLQQRIEADNEAQAELVEFLGILATDYELLGSDGLKDRSKLMEYRYDAV